MQKFSLLRLNKKMPLINCDAIMIKLCAYNRIDVLMKPSSSNCNCNYILFTKLPWPGDSEMTFRSSSQAATCPSVYHTRWRLHTVPLIAERQAGKL